jgi:5-formyltetrahydrofolate cyclo-ligase
MIKDEKSALRKEVRPLRNELGQKAIEDRSRNIHNQLWESGLFDSKNIVALYCAADGEVTTFPIFERLKKQGATVLLPKVIDKGPHMKFHVVDNWDKLVVSGLGIPEPEDLLEVVEPEEFDLVVVPGIAFGADGGRLGYGMGCYDRILSRTKEGAALIGIGYDFQIFDSVPMDEHDVYLTAIVSESNVFLPR